MAYCGPSAHTIIIKQMSIGTHLRFVLPIYLQVDVEHTLQSSQKNIDFESFILLTVLHGNRGSYRNSGQSVSRLDS